MMGRFPSPTSWKSHIHGSGFQGSPVEAKTLTLIHEDGTKTELIQNAELRYDILK